MESIDMADWKVRGQDHLVQALERSLQQGRLSHAYLLVGPPHVGKMTLAVDLARAVNCLSDQERPCGECVQCQRIQGGKGELQEIHGWHQVVVRHAANA